MAGMMERIFGSQRKPEPQLTIQQPAANPAVIAKLPDGVSGNGPPLPLDSYKDVWKTPTPDPNAPADPFASPLIPGLDPTKINEAVSKMDFLSGLPADMLTKATSGDAAAFSQVVNTAIQKALAAQVQLTGQMVEGATTKNNDRLNSTISQRIRETQTKDLRSSNPVLNHPAAAPMLDTLKRQMMTREPNLSPVEVQSRAEEMLSTFASSLVENKQQAEAPKQRDPSDFSNWS